MPPRFAKMLKRLREERQMSQAALARKAKVPQGYISALESGEKRNPGLDVLKRLARALGVPVTELLE
jgi:transcriptional regulator with XRE-family HTH domain